MKDIDKHSHIYNRLIMIIWLTCNWNDAASEIAAGRRFLVNWDRRRWWFVATLHDVKFTIGQAGDESAVREGNWKTR